MSTEDHTATMIAEFFGDLDTMKYPQPIVGDAIVSAQTDLNLWRMRKLIPEEFWEKNGRVTYSGRGMLFSAFFNEISWCLGPTKASEAASALMDYVSDIEDAASKGGASFRDDVIYFRKPMPAKGEWDRARLVRPGEKRQGLKDGLGLPLRLTDAETLKKQPVPSSTVTLMPIGDVVTTICYRAYNLVRDL